MTKTQKIILAVIIFSIVSMIVAKISPSNTSSESKLDIVANPSASVTTSTQQSPTTKPTDATTSKKADLSVITLDNLSVDLLTFNPNFKTEFSDGKLIIFSKDGQNNIQLFGTKDDIKEIDVSFNHIDHNSFTADNMVLLISSLAHDAVPEWKDYSAWFTNAYKYLFNRPNDVAPSKEITVGDKSIELIYGKGNNGLSFSITRK